MCLFSGSFLFLSEVLCNFFCCSHRRRTRQTHTRSSQRLQREERAKKELLHTFYTCKFLLPLVSCTDIDNHSLSVCLPLPRSFSCVFDTHTTPWLLCVSLFRRRFSLSFVWFSNAHAHISKSSFVFLCPYFFLSLSLFLSFFLLIAACCCWLAFFFFLSVSPLRLYWRGVCARSFSSSPSLLLLLLLLQCQHHERRSAVDDYTLYAAERIEWQQWQHQQPK